jgi:hypothetical protein
LFFFKKAILTNSQYSQAYINLAKVYLFMKDVDDACALFRSFPDNISTTEPLLSRLHEV